MKGSRSMPFEVDESRRKSTPTGSTTDSEDPDTAEQVKNLPNGLPSVDSRTGRTLSRKHKSKIIRRVLKMAEKVKDGATSHDRAKDMPSLFRQLAISQGGLIKDEYRSKIWPILAECHSKFASDSPYKMKNRIPDSLTSDDEHFPPAASSGYNSEDSPTPTHGKPNPSNIDDSASSDLEVATDAAEALKYGLDLSREDLQTHPDWNQVELDVRRTLARFPPNITDSERVDLQDQLTPLIIRVMFENSKYSYYQGFHDICLTFLLVLGQNDAFRVASILCEHNVFPFLTSGVDVIQRSLKLIYIIIWKADPDLDAFLRRAQLGCTFALSWYITWFAHVIDSYEQVVRLYDLFLSSHPLMPIYLSAAVVLYRSQDIYRECDCDMAEIHSFLLKTPEDLPLEALISDAQDLFIAYPPSKLDGGALQIDYDNMLRIQEERKRHGKLKRSMSWHLGTKREQPQHGTFAVAFWAVTATAAAWYVYTHSQTLAHWLG